MHILSWLGHYLVLHLWTFVLNWHSYLNNDNIIFHVRILNQSLCEWSFDYFLVYGTIPMIFWKSQDKHRNTETKDFKFFLLHQLTTDLCYTNNSIKYLLSEVCTRGINDTKALPKGILHSEASRPLPIFDFFTAYLE